MKITKHRLISFGLLLLMSCTVNLMPPTYAMQTVMSEEMAMEQSRLSYLMNGTDGKMYNVYIVGDNESFFGSKAFWKKTDYDQVWKADGYWAYVCEANDSVPMLQSANLFGKKSAGNFEYINRTEATYMGGIYVIRGIDGQPDMLVSARQMTGGGFVDYRFFVIKNGMLKQMKFLYDSNQTRMVKIGTHKRPYGLEDGTIAFPWFRQGHIDGDRKIPGGNFMSVFMPDFTNLILIHGYTYKE